MAEKTGGQTSQVHKKAVAEHFSRQAEYWRIVYCHDAEEIDVFTRNHMIKRREAVLQLLDDYAKKRSLRILDIGCGSGGVMQEILKRGHKVTGVDISEDMLIRARETTTDHSGAATYVQGDIEMIPFPDDSFDVVICVGVLQFLQDDKKAVAEMSRVLKRSGIVIVTLPNMFRISNLFDPYYHLIRGMKYVFYKAYMEKKKPESLKPEDFGTNNTFRNRRYYYGQLKSLFAVNGFSEISTVGVGFGPMTFWRMNIFSAETSIKISNFLETLARKGYLSAMAVVANRWVICLKKH